MDFKIELVTLPVSDVDRAKDFYVRVGFNADHDASRPGWTSTRSSTWAGGSSSSSPTPTATGGRSRSFRTTRRPRTAEPIGPLNGADRAAEDDSRGTPTVGSP